MEWNNVFAKYVKPTDSKDNTDTELCKRCGGCCCKTIGCHISPFDLKEISVDFIIKFIDETGCISVDWWEGNPITNEGTDEKSFFLRIRNKDAEILDPSYGGVCSILTDIGCPLSFKYRPKGARDLIPSTYGQCIPGYTKQQCAIDWYPYRDILKEVFSHYQKLHGFYAKTGEDLWAMIESIQQIFTNERTDDNE